MPAVPLAPDAQAYLDSARKAAESDLKKGGTPDSMLDLSPGNSYTDVSVGSGRGHAVPPPRGPAPPPSADAVEPMDNQEQAPPVVDDDYAADAKSQNTVGRAVGEGITQGVPQAASELGYGLMRGAVKTIGNLLGLVGVAGHDILSTQDLAHQQDTDDQIFKIVDGIKSAADKYLSADQTNANPFASTVGSVAEGATPLLAGPGAGLPSMMANSAMDSGTDAVKRGDSLTTAMSLALAHTVATGLTWDLPALKVGKTQLIPGIKSPNVAKRVAANIGGFLGVDAVTDALTKYILNNEDYKDAVEKYKEMGRNPDLSLPKPSMFGSEYTTGGKDEEAADQTFTPSAAGMNLLMGTMAAILHTPEAAKIAARADGKKPKGAPPPSDAAAPPGLPGPSPAAVAPPVAGAAPEANMPAPPPSDAATPPAKAPMPSTGPGSKQGDTSVSGLQVREVAAPTPADNPTAEPVADLQAQIADMNDPKTARKAVYLSPENVKSLGADGIKALAGGAKAIQNFDDKGGVLIVPDAKARLAAVKLKKSGADMQAVLGELTGAGDGKNPADTTVVQGQTPTGAVATESLVSPDQVPGAVAKATAEGKTPVVTDVASALDRRENATGAAAEGEPARAEPTSTPKAETPAAVTVPKFAAGDRRVVKINGEEVPVVVAGESADGKVPVKLIDEEGRVTRQVQNVPESMFVEPAAKAAPAEASPDRSTQSSEAKRSAPAPAEASGSALADALKRRAKERQAEQHGQDILDNLGTSPKDVAKKFWKETYFKLPAEGQQRMREQLESAAGMKPGSLTDVDDAISRLDLPNEAKYLEGSDRGFVALMHEANERFADGTSSVAPKAVKSEPAALPAAEQRASEPSKEGSGSATEVPATKSPLQQALDTHEESQTNADGARASLKERASATGELARVIETEAKSNKDIPENIRTEALAVAKQSSKMDLKSDEDFKKARGVSHKALDVHDENLRRVANNILHPEKADVRAEPLNVKAEKQKSAGQKRSPKSSQAAVGESSTPEVKAAKDASKPKTLEAQVKEALKTPGDVITKQERVEKILGKDWREDWEQHQGDPIRAARLRDKESAPVASGIQDVPDDSKPYKPSRGEELKISRATNDYMNAGVEAASVYHDKLEAVLRDIFGDAPKRVEQVNNMMELIRGQREDLLEDMQERKRPKKMSDDIEGELGAPKGFDYRGGDPTDILEDKGPTSPDSIAGRSAKAWQDFHGKMGTLWSNLNRAAKEGRSYSAKEILAHMAQHAEPGSPIAKLIRKYYDYMPDDVRVHPMENIPDYPDARGAYDPSTNQISLLARAGEMRAVNTRTILHEMAHALSARFMEKNPTHPLAVEMRRLLDISRQRALQLRAEIRNQGGLQLGDSPSFPLHTLPKTGDFYGLTNAMEMLAEAQVNPDFQRMILRSEKFASMFEGLRNVVKSWTRAIAKMLGLKDPKVGNLLENIHSVSERIMTAQRAMDAGRPIEDARDIRDVHDTFGPDAGRGQMERVMVYLDRSVPLPNEEEFRRAMGSDMATETAGRFRRAIRSGAVGAVRDANRGFVAHSQLVRTALRRGVFGASDETNPVRQWDEALQQRNASIDKVVHGIEQLVSDRMKLSYTDNAKLGQFQIDSTISGIDPTLQKGEQVERAQNLKNFDALHDEMAARWNNLTDKQRDIFIRERDANERAARANRKAGIDLALDSYAGDQRVTDAARKLLYSVDQPHQYADLIGGKNSVLDLGAKENEKLILAMQDLAGLHEIEGPYFHLGRNGDIVVHATPEGTSHFNDQAAAERFAQTVRDLSPGSKATVAKVGDSWDVDYKAEYTSMHENHEQAYQDLDRMRKLGFDMGTAATTKLDSEETSGALTHGIATLVADAKTKLTRNGMDEASEEAIKALRNSFVQLVAAHSSYAGSRLARRAVGGVKPEEMGRNFAKHIQSTAWNTGHMAHAFKVGEALGKIREATKDRNVAPAVAYQRGAFYKEISRRMALDNQTYGSQPAMNSLLAKTGFWGYMASFSHAMIYLTQNFSTTGFVAMSRWGAYKGFSSLNAAMLHVLGPSFRETYRALGLKKDAAAMIDGIMAGVRKSERFGKWAQGENSPLQQLIDRGAIHSSMSNQLAETARGGNVSAAGRLYNRVQDYARIIPSMADMFNRVSTGLAALELTNGDVYKAADFIRETHMDYSASEKPRYFKQLSRVPGGNSVVMFRTYTQGMAHLLYSHVMDGIGGLNPEGRAEGLKTVAGLMLGASLFAGLSRGMGLEPIRALRYTYNKLAGDSDEYSTFDTMMQDFIKSIAGKGDVADMLNHGILANHFTNIDISYRMGLSDLFFRNQPDVLSMDDSNWLKLSKGLLGAPFEQGVDIYKGIRKGIMQGDMSALTQAIPLKFVRDIAKGTPSGLASNDERKAQEKLSTDIEYQKWAKQRQQDLIKSYMNATNKTPVLLEMAKFSQQNPSMRIDANKIRQEYNYQIMDARQKAGLPGRDPVRNRLNDH